MVADHADAWSSDPIRIEGIVKRALSTAAQLQGALVFQEQATAGTATPWTAISAANRAPT